jgi:hypothetical protein
MGLYEIITGFILGGNKIYSATIKKIPGSEFSRQMRLNINGQALDLMGEDLRDVLAELAIGGVTFTSFEEKLKDLGLRDKQIQRRKEIMKIIKSKE